MKKKILILGTGNAQTDFIKYSKQSGFEVHTCSYKREGRGINEADFFEVINITDIPAIESYCKKENIDLIYSVGSDLAMPTVAAVSKKLGLKSFVSYETANSCNNKTILRKKLLHEAYSVKYVEIKNNTPLPDWNIYPAIVKPTDSQGQRGITKVNKPEELTAAIDIAISNSRSETAIIEEFIDGKEISINTYFKDGIPLFYLSTGRNSFVEFPGGIIKSHTFPVQFDVNHDKVAELVTHSAKKIGIQNGPAYYQVMIDKFGSPKLIEMTPRLDGCHIWRLVWTLGGPNMFEIITKELAGENTDQYFSKTYDFSKNSKAELFFYTMPPKNKMDRNLFKTDDNLAYFEWYYENGETVRPLNKYMEKVGYKISVDK